MSSKSESISVIIKKKRIGAGLTQADLARILGYSNSQFVSNIERGLAKPPLKHLKTIMRILKISQKEMFEIMSADYTTNLKKAVYGKRNS